MAEGHESENKSRIEICNKSDWTLVKNIYWERNTKVWVMDHVKCFLFRLRLYKWKSYQQLQPMSMHEECLNDTNEICQEMPSVYLPCLPYRTEGTEVPVYTSLKKVWCYAYILLSYILPQIFLTPRNYTCAYLTAIQIGIKQRN